MQSTIFSISVWDKYVLIFGIVLLSSLQLSAQSFPYTFTPISSGQGFSDGDTIQVSVSMGTLSEPAIIGTEGVELVYEPTGFSFVSDLTLNVSETNQDEGLGWPFVESTCTTEAFTNSTGNKLIFRIFPSEEITGHGFSALIAKDGGLIIKIEDVSARVKQPDLFSTTIINLESKRILVRNDKNKIHFLKVFTLQGNKVYEDSIVGGIHSKEVNLNQLPKGVYLLESISAEGVIRKTFLLR